MTKTGSSSLSRTRTFDEDIEVTELEGDTLGLGRTMLGSLRPFLL